MNVLVAHGGEARALLHDTTFRAQWQVLQSSCPWATSAQSPGFVQAWCDAYPHVGEPVLCVGRDPDGALAGLMCLVRLGSSRVLTHVGLGQAEYHGWIARPTDATAFLSAVLPALRTWLPAAAVRFGWLAPGLPAEQLTFGTDESACLRRASTRPILDLADASALAQWRRKGRLRDKLRQLERSGAVTLCHVVDADECDRVLDTLIPWYDARQAAVHGDAPFQDDRAKRPFHQALFRAGELHVTTLCVGDRMIAANLGGIGAGEVQIGVIAHDPSFARSSPGMILIRMLAERLREEGYQRLDLTAGGDAYKERFATRHEPVVAIEMHATRWSAARSRLIAQAKQHAETWLTARGVSRRDVKLAVGRLREARLADVPAWLVGRMRPGQGARTFQLLRPPRAPDRSVGDPGELPDGAGIQIARDSVAALLASDRSGRGMSRQSFLSAALHRLEGGQHCFTATSDGRLAGLLWLTPGLDPKAQGKALPDLPDEFAGLPLLDGYRVPATVQGDAVGRALVSTALAELPAPGAPVVVGLGTGANDDRSWPGRLGFVPDQRGGDASPPACQFQAS